MALSRKDWAETSVFVLGSGIGVFLAFMPFLIDRKTLSLRESCVIAVLLTVAALIAFGVSKIDSLKEQREQRQRDKGRDELIQRILQNQAKEMRSRGQAGPNIQAVEIAAELYSVLVKNEVNVFVVGDDKLNKIIGAAEHLNSEHLKSEKLQREIKRAKPKAPKQPPGVMALMAPVALADDVRRLADSLTRVAAFEKPTE